MELEGKAFTQREEKRQFLFASYSMIVMMSNPTISLGCSFLVCKVELGLEIPEVFSNSLLGAQMVCLYFVVTVGRNTTPGHNRCSISTCYQIFISKACDRKP